MANLSGIPPDTIPNIRLNHSVRNLDIDFSAIQYSLSENNIVHYRLLGYEDNWQDIEGERRISYMNLPPGTYTLELKAANSNGKWIPPEELLRVTVLPPYWNTWYFRIGVFIAIFLLIWGYISFRNRQMVLQNKLLQEKVNDRTHELENANQRERKARAQAEEAARAKSQFLANMSHEIRTPMNGMLGMAELLYDEKLTAEQKDHVDVIIKSGESLLTIINDILDFSKIESGKFELDKHTVNLVGMAEEVLSLLAGKVQGKPLELLYRLEPDLPENIWADGLRLRQILLNLVGNAIKFTEKGEICIWISRDASLENGELSRVRFSVSDTGIGIPEDKQSQLFESFTQVDASTTRKYGGTGLGLSISSRLTLLMGGKLKVDSVMGEGSTFYFSIDTSVPEETLAPQFVLPDLKKVLLLDQHESHAAMIRFQLESLNIQTEVLSKDQIDWERQQLDTYDAILCNRDWEHTEIPAGARTLKKQYPNIKWIHLAPLGISKEEEAYTFFDEIILKPVRRNALFQCLKTLWNIQLEPMKSEQVVQEKAPITAINILLAEDNAINQKLALRVLKKLGYEADLAKNGREVLERMAEKSYGVILMDVTNAGTGWAGNHPANSQFRGSTATTLYYCPDSQCDGRRSRKVPGGRDE